MRLFQYSILLPLVLLCRIAEARDIVLYVTTRSEEYSSQLFDAAVQIEGHIAERAGKQNLVVIEAPNKASLKQQLAEKIGKDDRITYFLYEGHGDSVNHGFELLYEGDEKLTFLNGSENKEAQEVFDAIIGRFADDAVIHFASCNILKGSEPEAIEKAATLQNLFKIKSGSLYGNKNKGRSDAYAAGFREMLSTRVDMLFKGVILYMAYLSIQMPMLMSDKNGIWSKLAVALTIPVGGLIGLLVSRAKAIFNEGYFLHLSGTAPKLFSISERDAYRTKFLASLERSQCEAALQP